MYSYEYLPTLQRRRFMCNIRVNVVYATSYYVMSDVCNMYKIE